MNPIDALAISMLAVICLSFGVVGLLFIKMARNASRHDPQVEELIHDALDEGKPPEPAAPAKSPPLDAWEREGDWWKKER